MRILIVAAVIVAAIVLFQASAIWASADDSASYYDQAYRMYMDEGQPKAQEIIDLLKKELKTNPENLKAVALLGITHLGTGQYEDALEQFDRYLEIDSATISPKILLKKAAALYMLGRHNDSRMILSAHWAFFQDSPKIMREYNDLYPAVVEGARRANLYSAYAVLLSQAVTNLQDYLYFAIDEDNFAAVADDQEISLLTMPKLGQSHGWMDVIAIPISGEQEFSYSVNFEWDAAIGFNHLNRKTSPTLSNEETRETVEKQRMNIDGTTIPETAQESISWQKGEVITDGDRTVMAYQLTLNDGR